MKTKWEIYQELELIPDTVSSPGDEKRISRFYRSQIWRSLVNHCTTNLSDKQIFNHLNTCFEIDLCDPNITQKNNFFKTIWLILNQPIQPAHFLNQSKPYIWKSHNFLGSTQWHIYDPKSGYTYDLDSEEDVLVWLEKRNYH